MLKKQITKKVKLKPKLETKAKKEKSIVLGNFLNERVIAENSDSSRLLYDQSRFGKILDNGKLQLSLVESLYLLEKEKLKILDGRNKEISSEKFVKKVKKIQPNFMTRYYVFKDMRDRGYIVKTALKFGADFRVYNRGIKPGEDHAKWILFPVHEASGFSWYEFSAKNRVAHSTKKRLLIGVVDDEGDVTYYEIRWLRP